MLADIKYWENDAQNKHYAMNCPKDWAVPIIGLDEYNYLLRLSEGEIE